MRRGFSFLLFFLLLQFFPSLSFAIINIESLRRISDGVQKLKGSLAASLKKNNGNVERMSFNVKSHLQHERETSENFLFFEYQLGKNRKIKNINKSLFHFRHIHFTDRPFSMEGFYQIQTDEFKRLSLRNVIGMNLRKELFLIQKKENEGEEVFSKNSSLESSSEKRKRASLGFGVFYSEETINELKDQEGSHERKEEAFRFNVYVSFKIPLTSILSLNSVLYYQPKMDQFYDYRLLEEISFKTKITENLSLLISESLSYDSRPPQNVQKMDLEIISSIRYDF